MHTADALVRMGRQRLARSPQTRLATLRAESGRSSRFYQNIEIGSDGEPHEIKQRSKPAATIRVAPNSSQKKRAR